MRTGEALETLSLSLAEMVRKQSGEPTDGPQQTAPVDLPTPLSVTLPRRLASTRKRRRNSKEIITLYVPKKKKKIQRSRDSQEGAQADDVDDDAPPGYVKNKPGVKKKEKKKDIKIKFRNLMYAALVRDSNLKMKMYVLVVGVNCSSLTHIPPPCAAACPNK